MFKKILVLIIALLMSGVAMADLNSGLMAYYNFDDCSANDSSANANNGSITGNLTCITGVANKALQFDGASYITVPNTASLNPTTQLTMSFWIKMDDFTSINSGIIYKGGNNPGNCLQNREYSVWLINDSSRPSLFHQTSAGDNNCQSWMYSKTLAIKGKWLHYTGVIDLVNHIQSIYINGVLNSKVTDNYSSFSVNNYDLRIGFSDEIDTWSNTPMKAILDEVRLYNRTLSDTEIKTLYNQGLSVNGTIKSLLSHTVTCTNNTTSQSITIPASTATAYDCEAKGLVIKPQDDITITINGKAQ